MQERAEHEALRGGGVESQDEGFHDFKIYLSYAQQLHGSSRWQ